MKKYEDFEENINFSTPPKEIHDSNTVLLLSTRIFAYFTLSLSAAQVYIIEEKCLFSQIDFFVE